MGSVSNLRTTAWLRAPFAANLHLQGQDRQDGS